MSLYQDYANLMKKSINHIFASLFNDQSIKEVYDSLIHEKSTQVAVEFKGTLRGEIIIKLPKKTLTGMARKFITSPNSRISKKVSEDVAGEIANLITGTFANQLQYLNHEIILLPPEINNDPISMKALYENINLSFQSDFGGFDIDLFFRKGE